MLAIGYALLAGRYIRCDHFCGIDHLVKHGTISRLFCTCGARRPSERPFRSDHSRYRLDRNCCDSTSKKARSKMHCDYPIIFKKGGAVPISAKLHGNAPPQREGCYLVAVAPCHSTTWCRVSRRSLLPNGGGPLKRRSEEELLLKFRRNQEGKWTTLDLGPDQLTLLAFATRWTCRVCPLPLANGTTLPTISTTGFLTVSIPKRR